MQYTRMTESEEVSVLQLGLHLEYHMFKLTGILSKQSVPEFLFLGGNVKED